MIMKLVFDPLLKPVLLAIDVPGTGGGGNTDSSEGGDWNDDDFVIDVP
jgi:hypothetical protein